MRLLRLLFGLSVFLGIGVVAGAISTPVGASSTMTWSIGAQLPRPPYSVQTIACPSATVCLAGMLTGTDQSSLGSIWRSIDGGKRWKKETTRATFADTTGIACSSTTACEVATANGFIYGTSDGVHFHSQSITGGQGDSLNGIACPSASTCFAAGNYNDFGFTPIDGVIDSTTNGGGTWKPQAVPSGVTNLVSIACWSISDCEAIGTKNTGPVALGTTNSGSTWSLQSIPGAPGGSVTLHGVACRSQTECEAVGADSSGGVIYGLNGTPSAWTLQATVGGSGATLSAVTCPALKRCEAVGAGATKAIGYLTGDGGTTWARQVIPKDTATALNGVSCPSPTSCIAGGTRSSSQEPVVLGTTAKDPQWKEIVGLGGIVGLGAVGCPSATTCVVMGFDSHTGLAAILRTADSGNTWQQEKAPTGFGSGLSISCPNSSDCEALGSKEGSPGTLELIGSADGGVTWQHQAAIPGSFNGGGELLSCGAPDTCEVVASNGPPNEPPVYSILGSSNGGSTWNTQSIPSGVSAVYGLSCPTVTMCEATGTDATALHGYVFGTTNDGEKWTLQDTVKGSSGNSAVEEGVSCATETTCVVVGSAKSGSISLTTTDGGNTWVQHLTPGSMNVIACPSTSSCQAGGFAPNSIDGFEGGAEGTTDGGTTWNAEALPDEVIPVAIACGSPQFCVAPDGGNLISVGRG